jgi:hypothetical protein
MGLDMLLMLDVRCTMFDVRCTMLDVRCTMFTRLTSYIVHLTSLVEVRCLIYVFCAKQKALKQRLVNPFFFVF